VTAFDYLLLLVGLLAWFVGWKKCCLRAAGLLAVGCCMRLMSIND
jgi:hypothetical protein